MNALVFGVLRWRARLDHIIGRFSKTPLAKIDPPVLNILRIAVFQLAFMDRIPASAAVNTAVDIAKSLPTPWVASFVNAVLRKAAAEYRSRAPSRTRRGTRSGPWPSDGSLPEWLATRWVERHGYDTAAALCAEVNTLPPLTLRANTLKTNRDDLARALAPDALAVAADRVRAGRAHGRRPADAHRRIGGLPGRLVPGAGRGGPTRIAAARAAPGRNRAGCVRRPGRQDRTSRCAHAKPGDITARGSEPGTPRAARGGDAPPGRRDRFRLRGRPGNDGPRTPERAFDRVLLDAPCSGLGTLRRNPDIKWAAEKRDLDALPPGPDPSCLTGRPG